MEKLIKSIRPFIGAKDFELSRRFYHELGFEETVIAHNLSVLKMGNTAFYLQNAYVKDWIDNTMIFLEVEDVTMIFNKFKALELPDKYATVRLESIKTAGWGREFFLHDPSGVLWHIGEFF